jgi:hypothetical protein
VASGLKKGFNKFCQETLEVPICKRYLVVSAVMHCCKLNCFQAEENINISYRVVFSFVLMGCVRIVLRSLLTEKAV